MSVRGAPLLAPLAVLGFLVWLAFASARHRPAGAPAAQTPPPPTPAAAPAPCQEPIRWRIASVDPRFGLAAPAVQAAAEEASALWTDGEGRGLFAHDPRLGMPIRLVYDGRQARTDERVRAQRIQGRAESDLEAAQRELATRLEAHREAQRQNLMAWAEHDAAIADHNAAVRRWNAAGNAPPDTVRALTIREERLRRHGLTLLDATRGLRAEEEDLRSRQRALDEGRAELDGGAARIADAFPPLEVESGTYLEARGFDAAGGDVTFREVRVFRFQSRSDLVRVLAHELGHALGLPHVDEPGALMSPRREGSEDHGVALGPADRAALRALCG